MRNVARLRDLELSEVPKCTRTQDGFISTNRTIDKLFVSEESVTSTLGHNALMPLNINENISELILEVTNKHISEFREAIYSPYLQFKGAPNKPRFVGHRYLCYSFQ